METLEKMPKVVLPDGKVLVGHAAEEYIRKQKAAEKEAKKAAELKVAVARAAGDEGGAAAAAADLKEMKSAALMSNPEAFMASVMKEIETTKKHGFHFFVVNGPADWKRADKEEVDAYIGGSLRYIEEKDAPSEKELHLFMGGAKYLALDGSKVVEIEKPNYVLEVHPQLLKKNGKVGVEIAPGSVVAVKHTVVEGSRVVRTRAPHSSFATKRVQNTMIHHHWIYAVVPEERKKEFYDHNKDDSRLGN